MKSIFSKFLKKIFQFHPIFLTKFKFWKFFQLLFRRLKTVKTNKLIITKLCKIK